MNQPLPTATVRTLVLTDEALRLLGVDIHPIAMRWLDTNGQAWEVERVA